MKKTVLEIAKYAYMHVPFYKEKYDKQIINLGDITDFSALPVIRKEDFIENPESMISNEFDISNLVKTFTSGTTGHQLPVYNTRAEQLERSMILWKEREKNCSKIMRERKAMVNDARWLARNNSINDAEQIIGDMLYLNSVHLDCERFEKYYEALNCFQPKFIHCPPSVIYDFVCYMKNLGRKMCYQVKYIELAGEYVSKEAYHEIKEYFEGALVINYYGAIEFFSIAHGCYNNHLHVTNESVYIEIVNKDAEGYGNLVITSLINRAMPLIRYDIGDIARISDIKCDCGKKGSIIELKSGRVYDYFIDGDRKVTGGYFEKLIINYLEDIGERENCIHFSINQLDIDFLQFNLVVKNEIDKNDITNFLTEHINKYLNHVIRIKVDMKYNMLEPNQKSKYKIYNFMK